MDGARLTLGARILAFTSTVEKMMDRVRTRGATIKSAARIYTSVVEFKY